ncbi:MAG: hypothetical protein KA354_18805 [Phycisphaerae bacterium]|nr:hypothetical protein [Phycisphaerae bacterium]
MRELTFKQLHAIVPLDATPGVWSPGVASFWLPAARPAAKDSDPAKVDASADVSIRMLIKLTLRAGLALQVVTG